jgi:IMP dehydrogenase
MKLMTFDDVLIEPRFSTIQSRSLVSLRSVDLDLDLPIISANMDSVTGARMAQEMNAQGGVGCLHRFWSIDDNVRAFTESNNKAWCSIGLGDKELDRFSALYEAGCRDFILDVAHGAQQSVVDQYEKLKRLKSDTFIVVGNFASRGTIQMFDNRCNVSVDAYKVGIGPGAACTTRIKTGCGLPQLSAIMECSLTDKVIIADGGMKTSGDIAKALAAGASGVMLGSMLAGTTEGPCKTKTIWNSNLGVFEDKVVYRGSASKESYQDQGKNSDWITAEGETLYIDPKGSVKDILKDIAGGLRSAFTYVGADNLEDFQKRAKLREISQLTLIENRTRS